MIYDKAPNERWYEFVAWNRQAHYGYGTVEEAGRYADILNRGQRENHYGWRSLDDADPAWIARLDSGEDTDGFVLAEALANQQEIDETDGG